MALQEPKLFTLNDVLHDRLFCVPPYQRGYSWTTKQRGDLFKDLKNLRELKRDEHFMATLVFRDTLKHVNIGGADRLRMYDIVDGQQRLTTLVILLKAIEKNLSKNSEDRQAEKIDAILVKEKKDLVLLQTNHDARETLDAYLRQGEIGEPKESKTLPQKELMLAFRECEAFVADWNNPLKLLDCLKNQIKFVFFVLEDAGSVYNVFEVLNSRGLVVDWLDKMKSTLMGVAFEKKKKLPGNELADVENEWTEIYRVLGRQRVSDSDVLMIAANLTAEEPPSKGFQEGDALEFFREEARQDRWTPLETSKLLRGVVTALDKFLEDPRRRALCRVKQARLLAAAILLSGRLKKDKKSQEKALVAWENVMFRFYVLARGDARDRVGQCISLAAKLYNDSPSTKQVIDAFDEIGNVTHDEACLIIDKEYVYDRWTAEEIIYFFSKYEEWLSAQNGEEIDQVVWAKIWANASKDKSIEHIFPQKDPDGNWTGKGRQKVNQESFVHRLGNLIVLPPGINSKAGTKSFAAKIKIYESAGGLHHVRKIMQLRDWNLAAIEKREKELMKFAKGRWWA